MEDQIQHVTITADIEQPDQNDQFNKDTQYLQPKKPINVKRIVLIVLLLIFNVISNFSYEELLSPIKT